MEGFEILLFLAANQRFTINEQPPPDPDEPLHLLTENTLLTEDTLILA